MFLLSSEHVAAIRKGERRWSRAKHESESCSNMADASVGERQGGKRDGRWGGGWMERERREREEERDGERGRWREGEGDKGREREGEDWTAM